MEGVSMDDALDSIEVAKGKERSAEMGITVI